MSFSVIVLVLAGLLNVYLGVDYMAKAEGILANPTDSVFGLMFFIMAAMCFAGAELANAWVKTARNSTAMLTAMEEQTVLLRRIAGVSDEVAASEEEGNTDEA